MICLFNVLNVIMLVFYVLCPWVSWNLSINKRYYYYFSSTNIYTFFHQETFTWEPKWLKILSLIFRKHNQNRVAFWEEKRLPSGTENNIFSALSYLLFLWPQSFAVSSAKTHLFWLIFQKSGIFGILEL